MMELQRVPQAPVLLALPPPQPVKKYELSSVSLSRSISLSSLSLDSLPRCRLRTCAHT